MNETREQQAQILDSAARTCANRAALASPGSPEQRCHQSDEAAYKAGAAALRSQGGAVRELEALKLEVDHLFYGAVAIYEANHTSYHEGIQDAYGTLCDHIDTRLSSLQQAQEK